MMTNRFYRAIESSLRRWVGVVSVLAVLAAVGCAGESDFAPQAPATDAALDTVNPIERLTIDTYTATRLFTAEVAGELLISPDMRLVIKPGAIDGEAALTAKAYVISNSRGETVRVMWDFSPDMVFNVAVELYVAEKLLDGLEEPDGSYHLLYLDGERWVFSDKGEIIGDEVVFELEHFSKYAVGD